MVKGQVERSTELLEHAARRDPRVEVVLEDLPTESVCAALGISEDNLFVRVHRARRQLVS